MLYFDGKNLDTKCDEIIDDISKKRMTSSSWVWIGAGAIMGLVASCLRVKKGDLRGKPGMQWNSKNNKGC